jgi:hypothetical protein
MGLGRREVEVGQGQRASCVAASCKASCCECVRLFTSLLVQQLVAELPCWPRFVGNPRLFECAVKKQMCTG